MNDTNWLGNIKNREVHTIVFDFDGVFTDNKVYVDQHGGESVRCDRRDGLGIDFLRYFQSTKCPEMDVFILSTEKNSVVEARAHKLRLKFHYGERGKLTYLEKYFTKRFQDVEKGFRGLIYLGNDLNDLAVINKAGYSVVPLDAHPMVKSSASCVLPVNGGEGFVRLFIEQFIKIKDFKEGEINELILNS